MFGDALPHQLPTFRPVGCLAAVTLEPRGAHPDREGDAPGCQALGAQFEGVLLCGSEQGGTDASTLLFAHALAIAVYPDAHHHVQVVPVCDRQIDGDVLDHADGAMLLIECQLHPEASVPRLLVPSGVVVAGLPHLLGPVLETHEKRRQVLLGEIHDLRVASTGRTRIVPITSAPARVIGHITSTQSDNQQPHTSVCRRPSVDHRRRPVSTRRVSCPLVAASDSHRAAAGSPRRNPARSHGPLAIERESVRMVSKSRRFTRHLDDGGGRRREVRGVVR